MFLECIKYIFEQGVDIIWTSYEQWTSFFNNELLICPFVINVIVLLRYTLSCKDTLDCFTFSLVLASSFLLSFAASDLRTMSECAIFSTINHIWDHCF